MKPPVLWRGRLTAGWDSGILDSGRGAGVLGHLGSSLPVRGPQLPSTISLDNSPCPVWPVQTFVPGLWRVVSRGVRGDKAARSPKGRAGTGSQGLQSLCTFSLKTSGFQGTWGAQSVKSPTSAQVTISLFPSSSPSLGSVLTAQSLEPALESVSPSLSAPPLLSLLLARSLENKH